MGLTVLGAVAVGVFCACLGYIAVRFLGRDWRFLIPFAGGAGMFGFTVWNDYDWFARHEAGLPERIVIVEAVREPSPIKPWTWAAAPVTRYIALDRASVDPEQALPGAVRATVLLVARFAPALTTRQLFDCAGARRADGAGEGLPPEAAWEKLDPADPLLVAACGA